MPGYYWLKCLQKLWPGASQLILRAMNRTLASGGSRISQTGMPTEYSAKFTWKWKKIGLGGAGAASENGLFRSATTNQYIRQWYSPTRKHSSRTQTARLPTVWAVYRNGPCTVRSKLNKFEHIRGLEGGSLYGEVRSRKWSYGEPPVDRMTDRHNWKHYLPATSLAYTEIVIRTADGFWLRIYKSL